MLPHRAGGGIARPGRGDVDLEALQDAFLRGSEKPSARVIRSKPPAIKTKAGASITPGENLVGGIGERKAPAAPRPMGMTANSKSPPPRQNENGDETFGGDLMSTPPQAPTGGMVLNAPGVVSSVTEREVRAPAAIKIVGAGGVTVVGGASNDGKGRFSVPRKGASAGFVGGGFPAVRHRSEMGLVRLGGSGASKTQSSEDPSASGHADRAATASQEATSGARSKLQNSRGGIPADIHEENLSRVSSMSPREIEEAQQEIRSTLTPADIEMLMRRGRAKVAGRPPVADGGDGRAVPIARASNRPSLATTEEETAANEGRSVRDTAAITQSMSPGGKKPIDSIGDSVATVNKAGILAAGGVMTGKQAAAESPAMPPTSQCDKASSNGGGFGPAAGVTVENGLGEVPRLAAGGPTGAQRAATAAGGIDSEESLAAALMSLPHEEQAKSSWTLRVVERATADEDEEGDRGDDVARVDLQGVPVVRGAAAGEEGRDKGSVSGSALYHHGDDPGKAGYTPAELVRLARSTVAGQRQLALRALAGVLRGRAACIARGEDPPHRRLPEMLSVTIRLCLDDGNPSVALAAANTLEAFLAPLAREQEDEEERMQGRSWLDDQAVPLDVRPLCTPEEKALLPNPNANNEGDPRAAAADVDGDDQARGGGKSAAELASLCYDDPCRGMIEMGLLPKLHGMIRLYGFSSSPSNTNTRAGGGAGAGAGAAAAGADSSNPRAALSCLRVAIAIARRAPWAAARVAVEPGLADAVREAFLEPREDGALPVDLRDTRTASPSTSAVTLSGRGCVGRNGDAAAAAGGGSFVLPGRLALLAVRLTRVLIQSDRDVALRVSKRPLLGATKGLLALGQGVRSHRSPLLQATQCEVLELWRACLSYGIDVNSADTVALISRGQGWWPGATVLVLPSASASLDGKNPAENGIGAATSGGNNGLSSGVIPLGRGGWGGGREDSAEETEVPAPVPAAAHAVGPRASGWRGPGPSVSLYRALHQLACACVLPSSARSGGDDGKGPRQGANGIGGDKRDEGQEPSGNPGTGGPAPVTSLVGGIECDLVLWAEVGDMVDSAAEATVFWLLGSCAGDGRAAGELTAGGDQNGPAEVGETLDRTLEAAAIHLVACWVERRAVLSRTADRRGPRQLASMAEDSAVLFSSLLASPTLVPAAVSAATAEATAAAAAATTIVSGLDWLSALFRLGLAIDKAAPGEARAALMAAPRATAAALSRFLSAPPLAEDASRQCGEGRAARAWAESGGRGFQQRSICRSSACARWLGCRLLGSLGDETDVGRRQQGYVATGEDMDGGGGTAWSALTRDCALQALALCGPGDEAVAVGLVAEALPDALASDEGPEAEAPAVLRKIFRGAISDPVALSHSSFHLDGRWASLQSLRACAPSGTSSLLPLPRHWLMLPLASQGGESAATAAVSVCLSVLVRLERGRSTYVVATSSSTAYSSPSTGQPALLDSPPSAAVECGDAPTTHGGHRGCSSGFLSPEVKLYYLANACMYGSAVLSGETTETNFNWLLTRYLSQCKRGFEARLIDVIASLAGATAPDPSKIIADAASLASQSSLPAAPARRKATAQTAHDRARSAREMAAAEDRSRRALLDFVKDLTGSFLADSFGLPCFARVLRMFLRTGFPAAARCIVWKELGAVGLLPLLDPLPPPNTLVTAGGLQAQANDQDAPDDQGANRGVSVDRVIDTADTRNTDATTAAAANSATSSVSNTDTAGCAVRRGDVEGGDGGRWGWAGAYLYPPDVDKSIIDEYLTALQHPRFGPAVDGAGGGDGATVAVAEHESMMMTMRSVAIHHLACYFFPPPPPPSSSSPSESFPPQSADDDYVDCQTHPFRTSPSGHPATGGGSSSSSSSARNELTGGKAGGNQREKIDLDHCFSSASWEADFGRRKRFERLLLLGRGDPARTVGGKGDGKANNNIGDDQQQRGRFARSVAEAVLGHQCGGVHRASAGASSALGLGGAGGEGRRDTDGQEACRWGPKLGLERRKVVQVYCESDGGTRSGLGDEDVVAWLETEGDLDVRDVVNRLRFGLNPS